MTYMATHQHKNHCFRRHQIYNFGRPFLVHLLREKICNEIRRFQYRTYMSISQLKSPWPWGHKIYNFGRPFLAPCLYPFSLSDLRSAVEKTFKEMKHFHTTYNSCPSARSFDPLVIKFTLLVDPSTVTITIYCTQFV